MPQFTVTIEKGGKETICIIEAPDADAAINEADAMDLIKPPCLVAVEPYPPTDDDDDEDDDNEEE